VRRKAKARSQAKNRTRKVVSARRTRAARQPVLARQRAVSKARAVVPVAAASSDSSSLLFPLALGAALGLSLLLVLLALTPAWALPRPMEALVYDRRELLIFVGCAAALSIGLGFTITFAAS
jgi:hypothetical protein